MVREDIHGSKPRSANPHRPRPASQSEHSNFLDLAVVVLLFVWASKAWFYPLDAEAHADFQAPFLSYFRWIAQAGGLYALFRIGGRWRDLLKDWPVYAFILWGALSAFWSHDFSAALGLARTVLLFVLCATLARQRLGAKKTLEIAVAVGAVILTVSAVMAIFSPYGRAEGLHVGLWRGLFGHKNGLGEFAAFHLILTIGWIMSRAPVPKWVYLATAPALMCLIFAGSANGLATLGIASLVVVLASLIGRIPTLGTLRVGLFAATAAFSIGVFFIAVSNVLRLLDRDLTFSNRTFVWRAAKPLIGQSPYLGHGWGFAGTDQGAQLIRGAVGNPFIRSTHNAYLQTALELGYGASALYVVYLVAVGLPALLLAAGGRSYTAPIRLGVIIGLAFYGLFESAVGILPCSWLAILVALHDPSPVQNVPSRPAAPSQARKSWPS